MLPKISHQDAISQEVREYLADLQSTKFQGEIDISYASRLTVSTDNSVYQAMPQAVIFPMTNQDLSLIGEIATRIEHSSIRFSPRGGGTGTNGQSLTHHIVVDLSRHMRAILEINSAAGWVRVQAGVVKDALNDALRPHGFFFSPDLSTSNRATIGGMINTDASGQGSLRYGKTSDHVMQVLAYLADGTEINTGLDDLQQSENQRRLTQKVKAICVDNRTLIDEKFPPLNRFLTGYDLKNAYQPENELFDLTRILCGSEGSLAFIAEATLNITAIPQKRVLVNIKYDTFDAALRHAPEMVKANALSVETIDSRVLNLAREDVVWHSVEDLIRDVPHQIMLGINLVEFAGESDAVVQAQVSELCSRLDCQLEAQAAGRVGVIGYQICDDLESINRIYTMRKKAVGLLGATKGQKKPVAFAEDTCVPPENLADFIAEFRALLDAHHLDYGMFGHVDAGVLHVRPALDLCDPNQELLMRQISDQVVALVSKYGGLMWGEHGKGYRSEYGPEFFGKTLFDEIRKVKAAFDPLNRMNPGKICTPWGNDESLVSVDDLKKGGFDRQIPIEVRDSYQSVVNCNGNGLCFNYDTSSPMCPSMKVSYDRRHSPKGRAAIVREWLRLLAQQGVDPLVMEQAISSKSSSIREFIEKFKNTWLSMERHDDFSHEVMEVMQGCLACKACASQCPIKIDVPSFRSRFINLYYSRYQRPVKDHLVANIETLLPWMAKAPRLINGITQFSWVQKITEHLVGYVDTPALSVPTLETRLKSKHLKIFDLELLSSLSLDQQKQHVLVVQDPFTSFYEAELIEAFIELIQRLGKIPVLLPFHPNGKAQHVKGFLKEFSITANSTGDFLNQVATLNMPLVGVDPALVLCYRDEYRENLLQTQIQFSVKLCHEWLVTEMNSNSTQSAQTSDPWYLLSHCTEKTKLPASEKMWQDIFSRFGARLHLVPVGCCGMAGTFGHEADKSSTSRDIYGLSWEPQLEQLPSERCLATGYSCRSQVKRFSQAQLLHPIQALLHLLTSTQGEG